MLNFNFSEKGLGMVSTPHFLNKSSKSVTHVMFY